jgi:Tol biopolymer transport system component
VTEDLQLREILRATAERAALPTVMPQPLRRKVALRRARTIGAAFLVTAVVAVGGFQGLRALDLDGAAIGPAGPGDVVGDPDVDEVDYTIDLNTRAITPLPDSIIRARGEKFGSGQYAASPDGSRVAFVGTGVEETLQIFVAGIDGSWVRQVTHDPTSSTSPAWSPDGRKIAYEGFDAGNTHNLFVLDIATGRSTQVTDIPGGPCGTCPGDPQFTPDGASLIYTAGSPTVPLTRIVPVAGGEPKLFFDLKAVEGRPLTDAAQAALSPDGSLVTFMGCELGRGGCAVRFVANADGTDRLVLPWCMSNPAGTWSPDGTRIVCSDGSIRSGITVIDVATRKARSVAEGRDAIWLDDHTLLVEV